MMSYHPRSSCFVCGSTRFCVSVFSSIVLVSSTGMLEYMFVMSKEARVCCGSIGVFFRSCSNSWGSLMLNAFGLGASWQNFSVNNLDNLYAGAIYRKPTFTDTIIPFNSNHPTQHKYAAVRHLYNRLNTYNLTAY